MLGHTSTQKLEAVGFKRVGEPDSDVYYKFIDSKATHLTVNFGGEIIFSIIKIRDLEPIRRNHFSVDHFIEYYNNYLRKKD